MDIFYIIALIFALISLFVVYGGIKSNEKPEIFSGLFCLCLAGGLAALRFFECFLVLAGIYGFIGLLACVFATMWVGFQKDVTKEEGKDYISGIGLLIIGLFLYFASAHAFYLNGEHPTFFIFIFTVLTLIHFGSTVYSFFRRMRYTSAVSTLVLIGIIAFYWYVMHFIELSLTMLCIYAAIVFIDLLFIICKIGRVNEEEPSEYEDVEG